MHVNMVQFLRFRKSHKPRGSRQANRKILGEANAVSSQSSQQNTPVLTKHRADPVTGATRRQIGRALHGRRGPIMRDQSGRRGLCAEQVNINSAFLQSCDFTPEKDMGLPRKLRHKVAKPPWRMGGWGLRLLKVT